MICIIIATVIYSDSNNKENIFKIRSNAERVFLIKKTEELNFIIANRISTAIKPPLQYLESIRGIQFHYYNKVSDNNKLQNSLISPVVYGFMHWDIVKSSERECFLVASDAEGMSPFERPNNFINRLWIIPVPLQEKLDIQGSKNNSQIKEEYLKIRGMGIMTRLEIDRVIISYIDDISIVIGEDGKGVCVGCSENIGIWAKEISFKPLRWGEDKGILKGSFSKVTALFGKEGLIIGAIDEGGIVKIYSVEPKKRVNQAHNQIVLASADLEENRMIKDIVLISSDKQPIFIALIGTDSNDELWLYRNVPTAKNKWQLKGKYNLSGKVSLLNDELWPYEKVTGEKYKWQERKRNKSSLSIQYSNKKLIYAYITKSAGFSEIRYGRILLNTKL